MAGKIKYYSLINILKMQATYNMIIGERSNGKTYAVLEYAIKDYAENNNQLAIIRRWDIDYTGKRAQQLFDAVVSNGVVKKYTNGKWHYIKYRSSRWWFAKYDEELDREILDVEPFAFAFSLNAGEHDKSTAYPKIKNILFDEFITRTMYLPDEFVLFMNTLSTIIRENAGVKIFMCANTVNKYCPYFQEMGINRIEKQQQGTIDIYKYGDSGLTVAVEYCMPNKNGKQSDVYFAFNNPKLKMITKGEWEIDVYPHLPLKYEPKDIKLKYFIVFNKNILQADIVYKKDKDRSCFFTYIHRKTTPLRDLKNDIIFSTEQSHKPNWFRRLGNPRNEIERKLYSYFKQEKVFYQDNEVGEIVRNYLLWCKSEN